ncbi:Protein MEI2-like 3 [Durusdinium trenchii]|uniref:Protein MEI2-like 3 n=1 Tax=Durusdinium trenchii TaxID=1381693 RepID=A0ABP0PH56_9DINO
MVQFETRDNLQEAVRAARSPILSVPPAAAQSLASPGWIELGSYYMSSTGPMLASKDCATPQKLKQLQESLQERLQCRKWSEESDQTGSTWSTWSADEMGKIRPSMSNSSVSSMTESMTSFEANRSRAYSNGSSCESKDEAVEFEIKIEEEPEANHSKGKYTSRVDQMRWKPKHNGDFMNGKPSHKRWDYDYGLSHLGHDTCENMTIAVAGLKEPTTKPSGQYESSFYRDKMRNLPRESRHNRVPRNVNLQQEYENKEKELIAELEDLGFAGTFDFLYSPLDKGTMSNVGYAFVNFKSHEYASKCIEAFHNYRFKRPLDSKLVQFDADASRIMNFETLPQSLRSSQDLRQSGSRLSCSPSGVEGDFVNCMEANLAHYEKTAVNTAKMKQRRPVILADISSLTA